MKKDKAIEMKQLEVKIEEAEREAKHWKEEFMKANDQSNQAYGMTNYKTNKFELKSISPTF